MKFSIFSHVDHYFHQDHLYSYGPYVKEMNLWISRFTEIRVIAPLKEKKPRQIDLPYQHSNLSICKIPSMHYKGMPLFSAFIKTFKIIKECFYEMKNTDHIHIRCPGNIGLLACIVQIFFPQKPKTAKYAGNWDPESRQPYSYRLQKRILENSFLTRNMKVLVYGEWKKQGRNIIPFFTASYSETEKTEITKDFSPPFRFIFVGTLSEGKRPLMAIQILHELLKNGYEVGLEIYGEGEERERIKKYIIKNNLTGAVILHGNRNSEILKAAYINSHFSILPSKSEGWPKAMAEGMFFGCIPVATSVSCVPGMVGEGERGILIEPEVIKAAETLKTFLNRPESLQQISRKAAHWSQFYTLEQFDAEINKLL